MKIEIDHNSDAVSIMFHRLADAGADMGPILKQIGEHLTATTKERFQTSTAPDGTPWAVNSELTELRNLNAYKSSYKKDGSISAAGIKRIAGKKPLIGETKSLMSTIVYQLIGDSLEIGSPMEYAGTQQFGASQGQYGRSKRGGPLPWGDIPARPFLGLSVDDEDEILNQVSDYLLDAVQP